ncbi:MAG: hypothetical protein NTX00_04410 [Candidatus Parcubacteria bacterium]|nr:hypothetical protein [Candidatus Parcubacteria bacterium]
MNQNRTDENFPHFVPREEEYEKTYGKKITLTPKEQKIFKKLLQPQRGGGAINGSLKERKTKRKM